MDDNNILGVVLAGGQSKRFGLDKSQVILNGKILIDYILSEIHDEFSEILIITNNEIDHMNSKKISKIKDFKKDLGPLGGVLTAMKWVKQFNKNFQWIYTFPTDTPFFKKECLQDFLKKIKFHDSKLFFIKSNNTRHNIFGLWSLKLLDQLEDDLINKGKRKVETWANSIGVKVINIDFEKFDPFFNINTKEDLKIANKILNKND
ncbi:MAG: molybdenum cofactor guanylyltransferase [Alphaproteobacteria bacterium]|nr:molybdenum cofactor guanylyltransferase [Alphaproteobacteria bacterium]